jgi:hypothetical protein
MKLLLIAISCSVECCIHISVVDPHPVVGDPDSTYRPDADPDL